MIDATTPSRSSRCCPVITEGKSARSPGQPTRRHQDAARREGRSGPGTGPIEFRSRREPAAAATGSIVRSENGERRVRSIAEGDRHPVGEVEVEPAGARCVIVSIVRLEVQGRARLDLDRGGSDESRTGEDQLTKLGIRADSETTVVRSRRDYDSDPATRASPRSISLATRRARDLQRGRVTSSCGEPPHRRLARARGGLSPLRGPDAQPAAREMDPHLLEASVAEHGHHRALLRPVAVGEDRHRPAVAAGSVDLGAERVEVASDLDDLLEALADEVGVQGATALIIRFGELMAKRSVRRRATASPEFAARPPGRSGGGRHVRSR